CLSDRGSRTGLCACQIVAAGQASVPVALLLARQRRLAYWELELPGRDAWPTGMVMIRLL
ncbi:MAG TPA: hypothetical protein PLQ35_17470, partial [bacterium]|nr:hypothetical protein [bacterium]